MNFNSMKVSTRLILAFGSLIALSCVIVGVGLVRLSAINESVSSLVDQRIPNLEKVNDMAFRAMDNARIVRNIILIAAKKEMTIEKGSFDKNLTVIAEDLNFLRGHVKNPTAKEALQGVEQARAAYEQYTQNVIALGLVNKNEEATKVLYGEGSKTQAAYFSAITTFVDAQKEVIAKTGLSAEENFTSARTMLIAVGVLSALLGAGMALLIARSLLKQLGGEPRDACALARSVAGGNLSAQIELRPGDTTSLMAQLQSMCESLAQVVANVRENAESVSTASAQIAQGNNDLSNRTEEQASALEKTAASMEQMGATVKQNADYANQANQLAMSASTVAIKGGEVVGRVVETMQGIKDSSKKISEIISSVDAIAFQTNILALNAAVEAARAGEQGRGFAVVASEVRGLAQRSAEAAKEIKLLIMGSVDRVELGTSLVDQAGATMVEVVTSIKRVRDIVGEITAASAEQSSGVAQVGEAVRQIDQTTQQNAALVEESAAAAESLKGQAQQLVQAVAVFKLTALDRSIGEPNGLPNASGQVAKGNLGAAERRGNDRARKAFSANFGKQVPNEANPTDGSAVKGQPIIVKTGTHDWMSF